ncbi:MAG: hypothetical protein D6730_17485 [Bacteroidetes bacterium]|nr:MAG: hypothetical protein D6730_17485 [Bacteroidota bacterium]
MKVYFYSLFLAIFCCWTLPATGQDAGLSAYRAAEGLRKQNRCDEAIEKYEEAIRLAPQNYRYFFQMGRCELKVKDYEGAKHAFQRVIELQPSYTPAYSLLAKVYRLENDLDNAVYYYAQAASMETNPRRKVQYELFLVNLLLSQGEQEAAAQHLLRARELAPQNPDVLYYLAEIRASEGKWAEARQAYQAALATDAVQKLPPAEKAKYYYGLGVALQQVGEGAEAKKMWERAQFGSYKKLIDKQLAQENHEYFYRIALSYYLQGAYSQSELYLGRSLDLRQDYARAWLLKGRIAAKRGELRQAIAHYEQAAEVVKDSEQREKIAVTVANMYLNLEDGQGALAALQPVLAANPQQLGLQYLKARAAYLAGEYEQSISTLEALLKLGLEKQERAKYNFLLGLAARQTNDPARAAEAFRQAMVGPYRDAARQELDQLGG